MHTLLTLFAMVWYSQIIAIILWEIFLRLFLMLTNLINGIKKHTPVILSAQANSSQDTISKKKKKSQKRIDGVA
jgi:hypothetical protein